MAGKKTVRLAKAIAAEIIRTVRAEQEKQRCSERRTKRRIEQHAQPEMTEEEAATAADRMALGIAAEIAGWPAETAELLADRGINCYRGVRMFKDALTRRVQ